MIERMATKVSRRDFLKAAGAAALGGVAGAAPKEEQKQPLKVGLAELMHQLKDNPQTVLGQTVTTAGYPENVVERRYHKKQVQRTHGLEPSHLYMDPQVDTPVPDTVIDRRQQRMHMPPPYVFVRIHRLHTGKDPKTPSLQVVEVKGDEERGLLPGWVLPPHEKEWKPRHMHGKESQVTVVVEENPRKKGTYQLRVIKSREEAAEKPGKTKQVR